MNEGAGFDVDFALRLGRVDFEDAGTAPETLDLNDVGEANLLERPGKAVAMSPGDQVIQNIEDKPHSIPGNGFFKKKLRTGGEALRSARCIGDASQNNQLYLRVATMEHRQQLLAVQHGHVEVKHGEFNLARLYDDERLVRATGFVDFPFPVREGVEHLTRQFQKRHAVIHKQQLMRPDGKISVGRSR